MCVTVGQGQYSENIFKVEVAPLLAETPENKECVILNFNSHMFVVWEWNQKAFQNWK